MTAQPLFAEFQVKSAPTYPTAVANAIYWVKADGSETVECYVTDRDGHPFPLATDAAAKLAAEQARDAAIQSALYAEQQSGEAASAAQRAEQAALDSAAGQVQADWSQSDTEAVDYIKSKPDLSALTAHTSSTSNPHSVTKTQVGLGNVDNTSDADKPVSTATQTALDLKAPLASPALTGNPTAPNQASGSNNTRIANTAYVDGAIAALVNSAPGTLDTLGEIATALAADESTAAALATTVAGKLAKASNLSDIMDASAARTNLGLGSAATQASSAFDAAGAASTVQTNLTAHTSNTSNPHSVTKAQVGLGNCDNTADADKPISTDTQTALDAKMAKASNLSDVASASTARSNLGIGSAAVLADTAFARTDAAQSLSAAQEKQARANILSSPVDASASLGLCVNPFFEISQENGTTLQSDVGSSGKYAADQWLSSESAATLVMSAQQVATPFSSTAGFKRLPYSVKAIATTAQASLGASEVCTPCRQTVEGTFWKTLGWGGGDGVDAVVVGVVMASVTGTYAVSIRNAAGTRSMVKTVSLTANTPAVIYETFSADTSGTWVTSTSASAIIEFGTTSGSTYETSTLGSWQSADYRSATTATDWQGTLNAFVQVAYLNVLPAGVLPWSSASEITGEALQRLLNMRRPYDEELKLCKRYWRKNSSWQGAKNSNDATQFTAAPQDLSDMRAAPAYTALASAVVHDPGVAFRSISGIVIATSNYVTVQLTSSMTGDSGQIVEGGITINARM